MLGLLLVIPQAIGYLLFSVLLTFSSETPHYLLSQFSDYTLQYKITPESHPSDLLKLSEESEVLIVDISSHPFYFSFLDSAAELLDTVYLTATPTNELSTSKYRYFAHLSSIYEAESLLNLISFLDWENFTILSSFKNLDFILASYIKLKKPQVQINAFYYDQNLTESQADFLIKRKIKAEGVSKLLIIDSGKSFKVLEKKLKERKVLREGFQLIVSSKGIYNIEMDGALIVSEPGTENSISESNYSYLRIQFILKQIPTTTNFRVFLKQLCQVIDVCQYSLINLQSLNHIKVGVISDSVQITEKIIYPGNTTILNSKNKNKIVLSIANGTSELYHQGYNPISSHFYRGAGYAVTRINLNKEIENFELKLFTTDCGNTIYDPNLYLKCFSEILPDMGIAYLSSFSSIVSIGNLITLRSLNYSLPQLTPNLQGNALASKSLYPEFVTLTVPEAEYYSTILYFLSTLRWRSVIMIGSDDEFSLAIFNDLKSIFTKYKITIANPEESQIFPQSYTRDDFSKYKEKFNLIKNTLCRIYIITSINIQSIIESLYDIGLRKGDFIALLHSSLANAINLNDKYRYKLNELLAGSLTHDFKEFVGDYGRLIQNEVLGITNNTSLYCNTFDTVLIVKNAILHLMSIGEDYENPIMLMNYIRILKSIGCMGNLQIDNYSNYRSRYIIVLKQIQLDEVSDSLLYNEVITIDKYSQNPVHISAEIDWPDNTNLIPNNFIQMNSCGFNQRQIEESIKGRNVFFILS